MLSEAQKNELGWMVRLNDLHEIGMRPRSSWATCAELATMGLARLDDVANRYWITDKGRRALEEG